METNQIMGRKCIIALMSVTISSLLFGSGCATRTSPHTVRLSTIREKAVVKSNSDHNTNFVYSVAIRFPSGFQELGAKYVMADKVKEMVIFRDKKGRPKTDPYSQITLNFDPNEVVLKSMYAALQFQQCLASNPGIKPFLVPCLLAVSNNEVVLMPPSMVPVSHAVVDISLINPLTSMSECPAYKWQGCNMGYLFSPMVQVSVQTDKSTKIVAGTHRWLAQDTNIAIVLPEILNRRLKSISGNNWGTIARNYPILKEKDPRYTPVYTNLPAKQGAYYEFDSFITGEDKDDDFRPYWDGVASVVTGILEEMPQSDLDLVPHYASCLGISNIPDSRKNIAMSCTQAEWRFMQASDEAVIKKMNECNWFTGMHELQKSENKYLSKAKTSFFWNQFAQIAIPIAGAAAAGAASASAAASGNTSYNPGLTTMMTISTMQNLSAAGGVDQSKAFDIYKSMTGGTQEGASAVMLGLTEESSGVNFKTLSQIRDYAKKKLSDNGVAASQATSK